MPQEVSVVGKNGFEQVNRINPSDDAGVQTFIKMSDTMPTKKVQRFH